MASVPFNALTLKPTPPPMKPRRTEHDDSIDIDALKAEVLRICELEYARAFGESFIPKRGFWEVDGRLYGASSAGLWLLKRWEAEAAPTPERPRVVNTWDPEKRVRFAAERDERASNAEIETEARQVYSWVRDEVTRGLTDRRHAKILSKVQEFRSRKVGSVGLGGVATITLHTIEGLFLSPESRENWQNSRNWALRSAAARPTFEWIFLKTYPRISELEARFSTLVAPLKEPFSAFVALAEQEATRFPMKNQLLVELTPRLIAVLAMLCDVDPAIWQTHREKTAPETIKAVTQRVRAIQSRASSKTNP